jgi:hypothetical protein
MVCKTVIRGFDSHLRLHSRWSFRLRRLGQTALRGWGFIRQTGNGVPTSASIIFSPDPL